MCSWLDLIDCLLSKRHHLCAGLWHCPFVLSNFLTHVHRPLIATWPLFWYFYSMLCLKHFVRSNNFSALCARTISGTLHPPCHYSRTTLRMTWFTSYLSYPATLLRRRRQTKYTGLIDSITTVHDHRLYGRRKSSKCGADDRDRIGRKTICN